MNSINWFLKYIIICFSATSLLVACNLNADSPPTSLLIVDADGNNQMVVLSDKQKSYWGPAWSPDGTQLAFSIITSSKGELYLAKPDGSELKQLTNNGRNNYLPAWSPNGELISFISQEGDTSTAEIHIIHVDGTNEVRLTNNAAWEYGISWSPDGTKIVFGSDRTGNWQIYTMDLHGNNQQPLPIVAHGNAPAWSPDGLRIAFTSNRDGDDDIWIMNADGSDQHNLSQNSAWDDQPQWSPDGMRIAFSSDREEGVNIFVMNSDGSGAQNLTHDLSLDIGIPSWSPDSTQLIFHGVIATK